MRFFVPILVFALVLTLSLASPLAAKPGGKGVGRGHSGQHGGGQGKKWSGHKGGQAATDKKQLADSHKKPAQDKLDKPAKEDGEPADGGDEPLAPNKKEHQLANFQRQRDKKLAQAEHLREIAERNGNANLLANADRMQAQALDEYARKVAHLEKFGVTDPLLNPGGELQGLPALPALPKIPSFPVGSY
jgi:hypothetical protein